MKRRTVIDDMRTGKSPKLMSDYLRRHAGAFGLLVVAATVFVGVIVGAVIGSIEHSVGWGILASGVTGVVAIVTGALIAVLVDSRSSTHRRLP